MAKNGRKTPYGYSPSAWRLIGRGMEVGLIIGVLTYLGHLGDQRWETEPWLTLTGALLGMIGGSYNLVKDMLFPKQGKPTGEQDPGDDT